VTAVVDGLGVMVVVDAVDVVSGPTLFEVLPGAPLEQAATR
jgi:hypothetical protein